MESVVAWLMNVMYVIGAPGVGLVIAAEVVVPPIPAEATLLLAGFTAQRGTFTMSSVIMWATAGSLTGAMSLYWLARLWGAERIGHLFDRLPLLERADVVRANTWFERFGPLSVLIGRMIPGVRLFVSIPAGLSRMNPLLFALYSGIGSGLVNSLLVYLGFQLGDRFHLVLPYVKGVGATVVGLLVLLLTVFLIRRIRTRRAQRVPDTSTMPTPE